MRSNYSGAGEMDFQTRILPGVSRTFALTIPQLPEALRHVVTNAYLLCRIADTIEDDVGIGVSQKRFFHEMFIGLLNRQASCADFVTSICPLLSERALPAERELMGNVGTVIDVTLKLDETKQDILRRYVSTMCLGMPTFQHGLKTRGLKSLEALNQYCYCVAGVVGEMLTELFCNYSQQIKMRAVALMQLAPSFGQGLQMTNILKDIWDDRENGVCWLPQDIFAAIGYDLEQLSPKHDRTTLAQGITQLVGIAHAHLRNALKYTLLIPHNQTGIRRFCLCSIGLAILTLRRIYENPEFVSGKQVKVSRKTVAVTTLVTSAMARRDFVLKSLFRACVRGLPLSRISSTNIHFCHQAETRPEPSVVIRTGLRCEK